MLYNRTKQTHHLKDAGTVGRAPGIQKIVFARADEPLATVSKLERQHAAVVQVQLVFVRLGVMQHFDVTVFHPESKQQNIRKL